MLSTSYTESYNNYAFDLFETRQIDYDFLHIISSNLPTNYLGVDIGSNDGFYADKLHEYIQKNRPELVGKILNVDPYPILQTVICQDGEKFIANTELTFDFIICKYSIHFIKKKEEFITKCYEKLKLNGKLYIFTSSKLCEFPWTAPLQKTFVDSCNFTQEYIKKFVIKKNQISINKQVGLQHFINLIQNKGLSNLYANSQQELNECLVNLKSNQKKVLDYKLMIDVYELTKE